MNTVTRYNKLDGRNSRKSRFSGRLTELRRRRRRTQAEIKPGSAFLAAETAEAQGPATMFAGASRDACTMQRTSFLRRTILGGWGPLVVERSFPASCGIIPACGGCWRRTLHCDLALAAGSGPVPTLALWSCSTLFRPDTCSSRPSTSHLEDDADLYSCHRYLLTSHFGKAYLWPAQDWDPENFGFWGF